MANRRMGRLVKKHKEFILKTKFITIKIIKNIKHFREKMIKNPSPIKAKTLLSTNISKEIRIIPQHIHRIRAERGKICKIAM
jgi:hypothetical protein